MSEPFDVKALLQYRGPDWRRQMIDDGVTLHDYRGTDENERNIATLLSSQGIPFAIERPQFGWTGTHPRLLVTVPQTELDRAIAVLSAGVEASVVARAEGSEGLYSR